MLQFIKNLFARVDKQTKKAREAYNATVFANRETFAKICNDLGVSMVEQFVDTNGDVYYSYARPDDLPVERTLQAETTKLAILYAITPTYMSNVQKQMIDALQSGDGFALQQVVSSFVNVMQATGATTGDEYIKLASLYLVRHDENPTHFSTIMQQKKFDRAKVSPALSAFFLSACYDMITTHTNLLLAENLNDLKISSKGGFLNYIANLTN